MHPDLIAIPTADFRSSTLHIALLNCGHRIPIDGKFVLQDGKIYWQGDPSWVLFSCPYCWWKEGGRIVRVWRVDD